ncbi:hypothetical protein Nepgr_022232, partial [Nepenthes gracilis]
SKTHAQIARHDSLLRLSYRLSDAHSPNHGVLGSKSGTGPGIPVNSDAAAEMADLGGVRWGMFLEAMYHLKSICWLFFCPNMIRRLPGYLGSAMCASNELSHQMGGFSATVVRLPWALLVRCLATISPPYAVLLLMLQPGNIVR